MVATAAINLTREQIEQEIAVCALYDAYFINEYVKIYDAQIGDWIPFRLWPAQLDVLELMDENQLIVALKARQIGLTWLALGKILHEMLFRPIASAMIFSKRDDEAVYLLGEERLRGMYNKLPEWMQAREVKSDSAHLFALSNGSTARAFPTNAGDSYTASIVLVDEADLVPDLNRLMRSVKPTIDAGGKLMLVSRVDKTKPNSEFKNIYKAAKQRKNDWACIFLPWYVRPERDESWYEAQKRDILHRTGSLDDLHEQYPATDTEALAPSTKIKRLKPEWLEQCYDEGIPFADHELRETGAPAIPGLLIYVLPEKGRRYVGGLDPAEGNPTSDDSAMVFLDATTGEEVAMLSGKLEPSTMGAHADKIGTWYNHADLMVERNNHGHAVLLWLKDNSKLKRLEGIDGKEGWLSNSRGKTILYDGMADALRDEETTIRSFKCWEQLSSIEGSTLRAPEGDLEDCADGYALAWQGVVKTPQSSLSQVPTRGFYPSRDHQSQPNNRRGGGKRDVRQR